MNFFIAICQSVFFFSRQKSKLLLKIIQSLRASSMDFNFSSNFTYFCFLQTTCLVNTSTFILVLEFNEWPLPLARMFIFCFCFILCNTSYKGTRVYALRVTFFEMIMKFLICYIVYILCFNQRIWMSDSVNYIINFVDLHGDENWYYIYSLNLMIHITSIFVWLLFIFHIEI